MNFIHPNEDQIVQHLSNKINEPSQESYYYQLQVTVTFYTIAFWTIVVLLAKCKYDISRFYNSFQNTFDFSTLKGFSPTLVYTYPRKLIHNLSLFNAHHAIFQIRSTLLIVFSYIS